MFSALPVTSATLRSSVIVANSHAARRLDSESRLVCNRPIAPTGGGNHGNGTLHASRDRVRGTVPKMIDLTEKVLFGDVWERPKLSKRDRSLIVCATLIATYRPEQLRGHCSARWTTA